jgi:hypothetical protein
MRDVAGQVPGDQRGRVGGPGAAPRFGAIEPDYSVPAFRQQEQRRAVDQGQATQYRHHPPSGPPSDQRLAVFEHLAQHEQQCRCQAKGSDDLQGFGQAYHAAPSARRSSVVWSG